MDQLLVKPSDAASMIAVSRSTLYRLLAAGEIPSVRIKAALRVPVDGLRAWVASNTDGGSESARDAA